MASAGSRRAAIAAGHTAATTEVSVTAMIPKQWRQPLTLKGICLHNYGFNEPAEIRLRAARLEVTIDPKRRLKDADDAHKTNDKW